MCFGGGGGGGGTITMPDTGAYDRMAQSQISAMQSVQDNQIKIKQNELNSVLSRQQEQMTQLRDLQVQRANDTNAQASRLAALIGAPPPEKTAEAPVTAADQGRKTFKGKSALRINRPVATSSGQGAGLNIT
jgi:membrane protein involved in colicin uptake